MGSPGTWRGGGGEGGQGGSGLGGALCNAGTAILVNCTLAYNGASGGQGGQGGPLGDACSCSPGADGGAGGGAAAAIANLSGLSALTNCTLALNDAYGGSGGQAGSWFPGGGGMPGQDGPGGDAVGGIRNTGTLFQVRTGTVLLVNCILATNSGTAGQSYGTNGLGAGNLLGPITDLGHNLSSDASAQFTGPGSLVSTDPKLGPLADYGGPTPTLALLPGSPAIGAADSASAPPTDQRGFPRPSGSADIGAYEFGYPPSLEAPRAPEGGIDLSVSGRAGQVCRLLASPDLVNWTAIATNSFGSSGTIVFHDPTAAGQTQRFYRAVMP